MEPLLQYIGVVGVGLLASIVSGLAGSGSGLFTTPFLIFLGLPPHIALGTVRFAALGNTLGALQKLARGGQVVWSLVLPLSVISVVAALLGAQLLLAIDEQTVSIIVAVVMILMTPIVFFNGKHGLIRMVKNRGTKAVGYILYALIAYIHAAFGSGIATFLNINLIYAFGLTATEASATRRVPTMVLFIVTFVVFAQHGLVYYTHGIILFISMLIGSSFGAHLALKKGNRLVMRMLGLVVCLSAVKLLFL